MGCVMVRVCEYVSMGKYGSRESKRKKGFVKFREVLGNADENKNATKI